MTVEYLAKSRSSEYNFCAIFHGATIQLLHQCEVLCHLYESFNAGTSNNSGCFCGVFLSTVAQSLLICTLSRSISTRWFAKNIKLKNNYASKHNTIHKTQNNQHELPPPFPPEALHSPSMGWSAALTTHGAMSSYGSMLSASGRALQHSGWLPCFGCQTTKYEKIERWAEPRPLVATI